MNNYIFEYYQNICDGSIVVGKWIRLFYAYIINGLEKGEFNFNQKKANRAIKFIENFVHHYEGRSGYLKLELWQKAMISVVFGIVDDNNLRQFREVVTIISRKNGKSILAAGIAEYMVYGDNEPGAKAYFVAPKLDQADAVYNAFKNSVDEEPELSAITKPRKSDLYVASTKSSIKKIAFNAKKSDGFNPHVVICDEISSWPGANGLKQYEVMKSGCGARNQPLIFSISTSGYENEGIYDELIKRCMSFLLGNSKEKRLAPFLYMIDDIEKWNDINELRKSNPNMGVSVKVDYLLDEITIAETSLSKKVEFITKYCNIKQSSSIAWLRANDIEKCFSGNELNIEDFKSCYAVAGIDLSQTTDLTAAIVLIQKKEKIYGFAQFFMPAEKLEEAIERDGIPYNIYVQKGWLKLSGDNFVDYKDCEVYMNNLLRNKIYPLKVGYDRYSAQYLVQDLNAIGFNTDDVYQGENLTPVIQETEGLIKDGAFDFGNNDLLKIHLANSALKANNETNKVKLIKIAPRCRIDGVAALLDAMCVRQKYYNEIGEQLKNKRRS